MHGAMDSKGRLTRWDEWRIGDLYKWCKGPEDPVVANLPARENGYEEPPLRCVKVDRCDRCVWLDAGNGLVRSMHWRNRYKPIERTDV
jgi:hypothetical protein